jgi:hypothetical protein
MHKQTTETATGPETTYFDMAADDDTMADAPSEASHKSDHPLFGPEIDLTNENLFKTVDRQPMRSKTINKTLKETGKQNTKRKEKLAKDEHDEDVAKVAQSDVQDVAIETSRKAVKKSAFTKFVSEHLGKVKTDVDSKVNKELSKINKIEPTDEEILAVAKAYDERKAKPKRNAQKGGSAASTDPPKKAERKSSKRKRSKSPDPETLIEKNQSSKPEKNQLSKQEVKAIGNYDLAIDKGSLLVHYKTENEWRDALGKKRTPYEDQMALRKLKFNKNITIPRVIQAILTYDKK